MFVNQPFVCTGAHYLLLYTTVCCAAEELERRQCPVLEAQPSRFVPMETTRPALDSARDQSQGACIGGMLFEIAN